MKRLFLLGLALVMAFAVAACDVSTTSPKGGDTTTTTTTADQGNTDVDALYALLVAEGYSLDERDEDSRAYYNQHAVNEEYNITVTVTDVYLGYVNQVERWAELIGFYSESDALAYTNAIEEQDDSGLLFYQSGSAVVITYSQDTINALD